MERVAFLREFLRISKNEQNKINISDYNDYLQYHAIHNRKHLSVSLCQPNENITILSSFSFSLLSGSIYLIFYVYDSGKIKYFYVISEYSCGFYGQKE